MENSVLMGIKKIFCNQHGVTDERLTLPAAGPSCTVKISCHGHSQFISCIGKGSTWLMIDSVVRRFSHIIAFVKSGHKIRI